MRLVLILVGSLLELIGVCPLTVSVYTSIKIERMRKVRGEIPGASFVTGRVERKWSSPGSDGDVYYIDVRYSAASGVRTERQNVDASFWSTLSEGAPIRVALFPGDDEMYLPDGIWASPGNLEFDRGLLIGERVVGFGMLALGGAMLGIGGCSSCAGAVAELRVTGRAMHGWVRRRSRAPAPARPV